jgi:hypothetical protein
MATCVIVAMRKRIIEFANVTESEEELDEKERQIGVSEERLEGRLKQAETCSTTITRLENQLLTARG